MRPLWGAIRHVHFVGIGGAGMCPLAQILMDDGLTVSGCDHAESDRTHLLSARGATVVIGHPTSHVEGVDAVVVSAAVTSDSPELEAARANGIPIVKRATLVAEVIRGGQSVAVAGTHGKTTTAALLSHMLEQAGAGPTTMVGGLLRGINGYGRRGLGNIAICEADEFDRSFLELNPLIAVVTNVEADHLDCYESDTALHAAFTEFVSRPPFHGAVLICGDDSGAESLAGVPRAPVMTYGLGSGNDLRATSIEVDGLTSSFTVEKNGRILGTVQLSLTGDHNVRNALAALGVAIELGFEFHVLAKACADFRGVGRRFEYIGERCGVTVIDDYAHHPTEITAVLGAVREAFPNRRIVAVFQPHLFSRTRNFAGEFAEALSAASLAVVLPIFPARETPIPGVTHRLILQSCANNGSQLIDGIDFDHIGAILDHNLNDGDVLITLGAGDVDRVAIDWVGAVDA